MKVSIICSDESHPINKRLKDWMESRCGEHDLELVRRKEHLLGGDVLFLISCHQIITKDIVSRYKVSLVIHASDVPKGRGWSPHIWKIASGENDIVVSLLEAAEGVDSGPIWAREQLSLEGHELADEINEKLFSIEFSLMDTALQNFGKINAVVQPEDGATYYRKRTPEDSRLDIERSIREQFNLMRVADSKRFPLFFDYAGHRYYLTISKEHPGERS